MRHSDLREWLTRIVAIVPTTFLAAQTAPPLAKEFIYVNDRMLAIENAPLNSPLKVTPNGTSGRAAVYDVRVPQTHVNPATGQASALWFAYVYISAGSGTDALGCQVIVDSFGNLNLQDGLGGWIGFPPAGSNQLLVNSVCALDAKLATFQIVGGEMRYNLPITFLPYSADNVDDTGQKSGRKDIWLASLYLDGHFAEGTPYVWRGNHTLSPQPLNASAAPANGTGSRSGVGAHAENGVTANLFGAVRGGWIVHFWIGDPGTPSCHIVFDAGLNPKRMWLLADNDFDWITPEVTLGIPNQQSNSQCTVKGEHSDYTVRAAPESGTRWEVQMEFKPAFTGPKRIWVEHNAVPGVRHHVGDWTPN